MIFIIHIAFFLLRILFLFMCSKLLLMFLIAALLSVYISICFSLGIVRIAAQIAISSAVVDVGHPSAPNTTFSSAQSCALFICTHPIPMFLCVDSFSILMFIAPSVYIVYLLLFLAMFLF